VLYEIASRARLDRSSLPLTCGRILALLIVALAALGAAPASGFAQAPLTGFLATPTEQLAIPGNPASGEITPEGDIYTGWAEYQLSYGRTLRAWYQPTRVLPTPSVPVYLARVSDGKILYTQQVFTAAVGGQPVVYLTLSAKNVGRGAQTARAALQVEYTRGPLSLGFDGVLTSPSRYERPRAGSQLGVAFDPAWSYSMRGRDLVRDGLLLARGPKQRAYMLATAPSDSPQAPHDKASYTRRLAPQASCLWAWQIPLVPPSASASQDRELDGVSLAAAHAALVGLWRRQEAGMTQITVPEPRVNAVYEANVVQMLQSRYQTPAGWVQAANRLQYQSYWIRDSSIETVALDDIGLHGAAAENLANLANWQQPDGLYISRAGQQDGVGQALWELAEHAELTHSQAFAASELQNVGAAVGWIAQASANDRLGLLPASTPADDEFIVGGHITGDDLWAAMGLRSAVSLAQLAGQPALASSWQSIDNRFEAALDRAIMAASASVGHIPPSLDSRGGYDWGNYWAAYPLPILAPDSPLVRATVAWASAQMREGLATWADGITLHDYLGFPIFETELAGGEVASALNGFYAELVHTTSPGYGWEDGPAPYGNRDNRENMAPHGTFASQFVTMLRNMLVRDDPDGVTLLSGVSPAWMHPGERVSASHAATQHGEISFTLSATRSGATLRWASDTPAGTELDWALPYWVRSARTADGKRVTGALALTAASGTATLRFSARLPRQSAAGAVRALDRAYRAHGQPAPIVSANG